MLLKNKGLLVFIMLVFIGIAPLKAGIYGYQRLYHAKTGVYIDLVYDKHIPYRNPHKKINTWEENFHPVDRVFFEILGTLNKSSQDKIDLFWEGYKGCSERDSRSNAPFIIQASVKLAKDLDNKILFNYSDTQRPIFALALNTFLDAAIDGIDTELKKYSNDVYYHSGYNPVKYIKTMANQGFSKGLSTISASFVKDLKEVMFKNISYDHAQKIKNTYGIATYDELKSYFISNKKYWRIYYKNNFLNVENATLEEFINQGGINALVNLPYNSDVCRDLIPFHKIPRNMFDNYQEIFDLELLFNILSSDKKRIIIYAGGAHCANVARFLKTVGFESKCYKEKHLNFLHPRQLEFLRTV